MCQLRKLGAVTEKVHTGQITKRVLCRPASANPYIDLKNTKNGTKLVKKEEKKRVKREIKEEQNLEEK